ncbi:MAG: GH92 family glycosyl hydrolase, partial [Rubricoccaceae bacterium]|nr:GH92 family glycosyl hydrolase [Rubricoccaceae bacterium]
DPDRTRDFIRTMLLIYEQGGRLPVWELAANETDTMIGFHSVPVIADAYAKGIRGFDAELALEAMIAASQHSEFGQPEFNERGFLSIEDESESVSKTLEYAYDHWVISQMAEWLGRDDVAERHRWLSLGYRNTMDPDGFMRPRRNGGWLTPFDPREVNNHYTEANSWQYSFFVPHDIGGWMELLGGPEALEHHLDALFTAPTETTGRDQADITGLIGQYAQGNEPSHHFAYLYNYAGAPHKTQQRVRQILTTLFRPTPDGLPGNEDCGQMSAWFVMSALGLYPVTPGTTQYALSSPLFRSATLHIDDQKFVISTSGVGPYIQAAQLNDQPFSILHLQHDEILGGGEFAFQLSQEPSAWGGMDTIRFVSDESFVRAPIVLEGERSFRGEQMISFESVEPGELIHYTLDGSIPDEQSPIYSQPFLVDTTTILRAIAVTTTGVASAETRAEFIQQRPNNWTITLDSEYAPQYSGGGNDALIDGIHGDTEWRKGDWQGFYGQDVVATIDLKEIKSISAIYASFLQDTGPWIIYPKEVIFEISADGLIFTEVLRSGAPLPPEHQEATIAEFGGSVGNLPIEARYIRMRAVTFGALPDWHLGAGNPAWVFADEIWIQEAELTVE